MSKRFCPKCDSDRLSPLSDRAQSGNIRWRCRDCKGRTTRPLKNHSSHQKGLNAKDITAKTLVITSAMANTDTDYETLAVLDNYVKNNDAQLIVIPVKYRNNDNINIKKDEPLVYDTRIEKYLLRKDYKVNKNLMIFAERSINATKKYPLSGKGIRSGETSGIFAHANLSMDVIATAKEKIPKILHTTGSISVPHYSDSDMGDDAKINHTLGAIVVEIQGDKFFMRQLMAKDGVVYDLNKKYTKDTVTDNRPENIVYGDVHHSRITPKEFNAVWGKRGIHTLLKPKTQVFHDILDFYADNHHHGSDALLQYKKVLGGEHDIKKELDGVVEFLNRVGGGVIVPSNHNDHLTQWVNKALNQGVMKTVSYINIDIMTDLTKLATTHIQKHNKYPNILNLYLEKHCMAKLVFANRNQEFRLVHADLGQHGDKGANGSRGSKYSFLRTGVPHTIGHAHTPFIVNGFNGVWGNGVLTMNMDYATGLSGWLYAHTIEHENGARQMIITIDYKFRPLNKMRGM